MAVKTADLRHEGGLRFVARTGSGFEIAMDNEAGGTAPRPTEVLAAAIGGCTAMDVVSILEKKRQEVSRYVLRVEGTQRDAHPHAFKRVEIVHEVEGPGRRRSMRFAARSSSPRRSTARCRRRSPAAAAELHHRYVVISPEGAAPVEGEAVVTGPAMELPPDEAIAGRRSSAGPAARPGAGRRDDRPGRPAAGSVLSCMTMRGVCIVMRGMKNPAIRLDRPDHPAPARPPASGPAGTARGTARAAAAARP